MLRFSHLLWAACVGSATLTLAGCMTNSPADKPAMSYNANSPHYDSYYGMPQKPGRLSFADRPTSSGIQVNPTAPSTYVVQKGDTLWGIARKFLNTPSYWPEIWDKNQQVRNPHQIYPGDILYFSYSKEVTADGTNKLVPRIRVESKGLLGETLVTLGPFLEWPRIMSDEAIKNAPYLLASRDSESLIPPGATVYLKNMKQPRVGSRYAIYHPDKPVHDPQTNALLGHQVIYSGYARVDRVDTLSTATILDMDEPIRVGDRVLPVDKRHNELRAPIQLPPTKIRGQIAALYDADYLGANCMIIVINRGKSHGIKPGYALGVYTDGNTVEDHYASFRGNARDTPKVTLPPAKVGEAIVYSVHDNLSYALITESQREIKNGDKIGNP